MANTVRGESSATSGASNSTPNWKYDVFLSFRGSDTRKKFTDHLYHALKSSGIRAFRDDERLERGEVISPQLIQAIKDSRCAVVVLSQNYADSKWCLNELQQILESMSEMDRRVFPIFYDVDPSDVRHQNKGFGEALAEHERRFRENDDDGLTWFSALSKFGLCCGWCFGLSNTHPHMFKVQNWRNALFEVGNLSGWDTRDRHEANLITDIVGTIQTYLCSELPSYDDNLVGTRQRMVNLMSHLEIWVDDVRFVGIWGMGGAGKTTLARVVYEKISDRFEMCSFLANVRETLQTKGLVSLQERLFSNLKIDNKIPDDDYERMKMIRNHFCNKKVLLVIDDLDDTSILEKLVESPNRFGKGSRIIITTRNSHVLTSCGGKLYEMKAMEKDESLQLFSKKAFNKDHPEEGYLELSKSVVAYAGGLPLALKVLGSFLCRRSKDEWIDTLDKLKQIPNKDILQILQISFDGLDEKEKAIFLDIACFLRGWEKDEVTQVLKGCDLNPTIGIKVLIEKTLLVEMIDYNGFRTLDMHDLLQELGNDIIRRESPNFGNRSRLWEFEDIKEVLENNKGSDAIQAIVLEGYYSWNSKNIKVHPKAFLKMSHIRLLIIRVTGDQLIIPMDLELSSSLKFVRWPLFPLKTLPLPLDKLVHVEMQNSKIEQLWNGEQFMEKLKHIDLSSSLNLIETPDFSRVPNLEHLNLEGCKSLVMVHPSLGKLKRLVEINLCKCSSLEILPIKLETNSLERLNLRECGKVVVLPEFGEGMNKVCLDANAITTYPVRDGSSPGLIYLDLRGWEIRDLDKLMTPITHQISGLNVTSLVELRLRGRVFDDGSILDNICGLSSLIKLDLSGNYFSKLPTSCFYNLFRLSLSLFGLLLKTQVIAKASTTVDLVK